MPSTNILREPTQPKATQASNSLTITSLFAGIGGFDRGLQLAGHETHLLCEIDTAANRVLHAQFPGVTLAHDIRTLECIESTDVITAGFPCQDLSSLGLRAGIQGENSGLVNEVFRLIEPMSSLRWAIFENVPFMLRLDGGKAMQVLTEQLEALGFSWAYRVVDTRAFGLPHRRLRVFLLASRIEDPREVLLVDDANELEPMEQDDSIYGFYWTEGNTGVGWAVDAVPTLKSGSKLGIPSPPAVWVPAQHLAGVPDIQDAERLQGFDSDWTVSALLDDTLESNPWTRDGNRATKKKIRKGIRWRLVGNAVSVPIAKWLGECLRAPRPYDSTGDTLLRPGSPWPLAAWGRNRMRYKAHVSTWPLQQPYQRLGKFIQFPLGPLSVRSTAGFLQRARASNLRFIDGFLDGLEVYLDRARSDAR